MHKHKRLLFSDKFSVVSDLNICMGEGVTTSFKMYQVYPFYGWPVFYNHLAQAGPNTAVLSVELFKPIL